MRMSANPALRWAAIGYIWVFRGTPALLQLLLWFNLALIFPTISLFGFFPVNTVDVMTPFVAAFWGLASSRAPTPPKWCAAASFPWIAARWRPRNRSE